MWSLCDPTLRWHSGLIHLSQGHQTSEAVWVHSCQQHGCPIYLLLCYSQPGVICGVFHMFHLLFSLVLSFPYPRCRIFHLTFSLVLYIFTADHLHESAFLYYFFLASHQIGAFNELPSNAELVRNKIICISLHSSEAIEAESLYLSYNREYSKNYCQNSFTMQSSRVHKKH